MTAWRLWLREVNGVPVPGEGPGNGLPERIDVPAGSTLVVGRREPVADVAVPHATVGRRHVRLSADDDALTVEDLGAGGGAWLNGQAFDLALAQPGDELHVGVLLWAIERLE